MIPAVSSASEGWRLAEMSIAPDPDSRLAPVRRRARQVKIGAAIIGPVVFGGAIVLARATYAGHPKRPSRPLAVPKSFSAVVQQNLLQAGILAPAQAPPDAQTSTS